MRKPFVLFISLASILFVNSCGHQENNSNAENSDPPQSMIPDKSADDGQGIGKYKNVTLTAIDENAVKSGKEIFDTKCSACHKTTDKKVVGPGLKGITERRQAAWILNMITNPIEMTQKDPTAKALLAEHLTQMTFQDVNDEQAKQILEYLRQNDSGTATTDAQ